MKVNSKHFIELAAIAMADPQQQAALAKGTQTSVSKRRLVMAETSFDHGEALRQQAAAIKRYTLDRLPELLEQTEKNLTANGVTVLWAADAAEACRQVLEIARRHNVAKVTKSKSMVTEEIGLNDFLEDEGLTIVETDLGEYILQLNHEAPSHIVTPVIHKSKESIQQLFEEKIAMPATEDAAEMAQYVRERIREDFLAADMGISGANFLIAETGSICLVTNEGNARLTTTLPDVHVAVTGIEKIAPTVEDYATLTQVLPRSATGQKLTVYTHLINGPRRENDADGPRHVYVVLVDNGRSQIYATDYAEALACIRCGACLNICPVYQAAGGHSYGWVYPGPIGAIVTPMLKGLQETSPLPHASSLCGACKQACPVDIDLPRMLLDLRRDQVEAGIGELTWDVGLKIWASAMKSPGRYRLGGKAAALATNTFTPDKLPGPLSGWTKYRTTPRFARKSFREQWQSREREKGENDGKS